MKTLMCVPVPMVIMQSMFSFLKISFIAFSEILSSFSLCVDIISFLHWESNE